VYDELDYSLGECQRITAVETLRPVDNDLEGEVQGCMRMCSVDILVANTRYTRYLWWRDEYVKSYNAKLLDIVLLYFNLILDRVKCGASVEPCLGQQKARQDFAAGLFRRSGFSSSSPQ
jgi:hypothetical protein